MADVPVELFRRFFAPSIRVRLNWDRLMKRPCRTQVTVIEKLAESTAWKMPWHFDRAGREIRYDSQGARPISICEIGIHVKMNERRRSLIDSLMEAYRLAQNPVALV